VSDDPVMNKRLADAMVEVSAIGPYFHIETHRDGEGWQPLREIATLSVFDARVDTAVELLAGRSGMGEHSISRRAAASIVLLGIAARLSAPFLALAGLERLAPRVAVDQLWCKSADGGAWPLAVSGAVSLEVRPEHLAGTYVEAVLVDVVTPLLDMVSAPYRLARRLLWGNVASGVTGALAMCTDTIADQRPDRVGGLVELVEELLTREPLRGTGTLHQPDPMQPRRFFVRRSCCLFMQVRGARACGDCVLTSDAQRRADWDAALKRGG
jgi:ferric iron reductase protein FhuF